MDDHDLFRSGLRMLLEGHGVDVVGEARSGSEALAEVGTTAPDVALMDLDMPGIGGVETTRRMASVAPFCRVLVLTVSDQDADVLDALMAGACGYLLKDASLDDLLGGIRAAAGGESLVSSAIAAKLLCRLRGAPSSQRGTGTAGSELTSREIEVLKLIAGGRDNAAIAAELHISPKTVKNHVSNILMKLQIENRIQAAVFAVRSGIA